ncbi:MAG: HAMP domain-containing histidine kinase [Oscillospiraceae bacterium]|nr:HAMP domain-containing histidine kinase [Oscillospiraceae bacterium]
MKLWDKKLLERLDKMLEDGINGTFCETDYDESRVSKLETKWLRYLTLSKLSQQKVEQEREKLKKLVSDISHQTKTPLANIVLYSQLLQEQSLDEQSQQLVGEIQQQTEKLEFLIQSLVKTSRLETGTFQLLPSENEINSLIQSAIEQISFNAEKKQIPVIYNPESCIAVFDPKWTQEALFNILDNAVKYSPENSKIQIIIKSFEMFVSIEVSDSGIGISEEELPKIFRRFYRGQNVREQNGVGIGLYLSRQIVEEQGGYIQVESKIGKGTVFKLFLPR